MTASIAPLPARVRRLVGVAAALLAPTAAAAQADPSLDELRGVLPAAERFSPKQGQPPVFVGYRADPAGTGEALAGYAFLTSDLPPETVGYNNPIQVLVGMDPAGALTGIRIVAYDESLSRSRGDFLSPPWFQEQFAGKRFTEPFRVRRDIDGISGATITVNAMVLGIRNASRRIAAAYLSGAPTSSAPTRFIGTLGLEDLAALSWAEMLDAEMAAQLVSDDIAATVVYVRDHAVGELLAGSTPWTGGLAKAGPLAEERHLMVLGIDGTRALGPIPRLFFAQGTDTIRVTQADFVDFGAIAEGKLEGAFRRPGLLLVDRALDVTAPFEVGLVRCCGEAPLAARYLVHGPVAVVAAPAAAPQVSDSASGVVATREPIPTEASPEPTAVAQDPGSSGVEAIPEPPPLSDEDLADLLGVDADADETTLGRTLDRTSWGRVAALVLLLGLASSAFATKRRGLRWAALVTTTLFLGFLGGGFLSVSHIISSIAAGPGVFLNNLPLLVFVTFTVVTTLLWGRVFCGYLCPFGALQDALARVVPKRFRRELPRSLHERALTMKYLILALVLAPVLLGAHLSLFQYFEPFGTVFFLSRSVGLWAIAVGILAASAIVPRFYCRYACPLGAALALGSILSPFRIRRVGQCGICKVCEQDCPTGAIRGPRIDFKECVRCNVCELNLIERAGSCRHEMEDILPRLVQLKMSAR